MNVSVLGDGAWGTALAQVLASNGHTVHLWCYNASVAQDIKDNHVNSRYLPDIILSERIQVDTDITKCIVASAIICHAVPVNFTRKVLMQALPAITAEKKWILASKGIEQHTLFLPSQLLDDILEFEPTKAIIAGPSFAYDLARLQLTAVNLACTDQLFAQEVKRLFSTSYFIMYNTSDIIGTQLVSALKNCVALLIGILKQLGYTDNTQAYVLTRVLEEFTSVVLACGGHEATVYGLAGLGDLILTSLGAHSKNVMCGKLLAQGKTLDEIKTYFSALPEGVNTTASVYHLAQKYALTLPILSSIYKILFESKSIDILLTVLRAY